MADKRKIVIEVDDSQFKKYTEEEKRATVKANEDQKRQTAQLKTELNERYASLKANLQKELIARQQGKELAVKEAIRERKILEKELRDFNATHRTVMAERLSTTRATLEKEVALYKAQIRQISSAPRTNLRGNIGSEAYVRQLQNARTTMLPDSPEFAQTTALINRYTDTLKQSGVQVKSLAQNIRGELTSALSSSAGAFIGVAGAVKLFNMSLESARFDTLKANFVGTTADIELFRKATSGTVDDASLIKLSNQATDLGVGLDKQAILFSLAEDAADKYGTSVEEGFQKVVFATEGNTKGLKMLGIQKGQFEELVKSMTEALRREGVVIDADTEKQIRLDAILKLSGKTIDDVKNKVQDSADKHEQFIVVVKNLSLAYGGDLFNAVTGVGTAYRVVTEIASKLNTVIDIQKNIILSSVSAWQNLTGQIPIVGDAISWLADRYRDLAGAQSQTAEKTFVDAGADFIDAFDPNNPVTDTRKGGNANVNKKGGFGSKNSGLNEQIAKQITFLEELRQKIADLNLEIEGLNKDLNVTNIKEYERLRIEEQLVKKREELNELIKETIALSRGGDATTNKRTPSTPEVEKAKGAWKPYGINPNAGNDPRGDMTSEELQGIQLSFQEIKGIADSIVTPFQNILSLAGLTETEFGKMLQMIQGLFNAGSSVFDIFSTVLSFIPGGSVVGGAIGAVTSGGGSGGMNFNPTIIVESEVEKTKSVRWYQNTLPEYNRRQAVKSLS